MTVICLSLSLAGCSSGLGVLKSEDGNYFSRSEHGLIEYSNRLSALSSTELENELEAARKAYRNNPDSFNRLRLAIVLMHPSTGTTDYGEAEVLLTSDASQRSAPGSNHNVPAAGRYEALARFLLDTLEERRQRQQLEARLSEELQKIDKLRSIERKLNERNGPLL